MFIAGFCTRRFPLVLDVDFVADLDESMTSAPDALGHSHWLMVILLRRGVASCSA